MRNGQQGTAEEGGPCLQGKLRWLTSVPRSRAATLWFLAHQAFDVSVLRCVGVLAQTEPTDRRPIVMVTTVDLGARNGPAIHFLNVARQIHELGFPVTVVALRPSGPLPVALPRGLRLDLTGHATNRGWRSALSGLLLMRPLFRHRSIDRLYLRSSPGTFPVAGMARLLGYRAMVVECNGWLEEDILAAGYPRVVAALFRRLQVAEARLADRVRVVTDRLARLMIAEGIDPEAVAVVGNGTDIETFHPLDRAVCRQRLGLQQLGERPVLAFVGNLWEAIDLPTVFKAMRLLRDEGSPLELLVVGDGVARGHFEAAANAILGPDSGVTFLGAKSPEATNVVLGVADLALAPFVSARNERIGLSPLKIRDFAAAARPCIATDLSGIRELASEPWLFLAEPESPPSYAGAVRRALEADREALGVAARAYAETHFDWRHIGYGVGRLVSDASGYAGGVRSEAILRPATTRSPAAQSNS